MDATRFKIETGALDRILVELMEHRAGIFDDPTGWEALRWMRGERGRGISSRVAAMSSPELYRELCHDAHGDPVPVMRLLDAGTNTLKLQPTRSRATRASLLLHAGFARDHAVVTAHAVGLDLHGVGHLDAAILRAWAALTDETSHPS